MKLHTRKFKSNLRTILSTCILASVASTANATVIQYFWGNTYNNPAMLNSTKNQTYTIGAVGFMQDFDFYGTGASTLTGSSSADQTSYLPYGSAAVRLNPKWVAGVNVSQPFFGREPFSTTAITNLDTTQTYVNSVDISPQVSYQVNDKLALGLGLDAVNFYRFQVNFVQTGLGNTFNKANAWAYGWNAGLFYVITPADYLSLYYYSKLTPHFSGKSSNNATSTNNYEIVGFPMPATTVANYIRMLTSKWALSLKAILSQWNSTKDIRLTNVASAGTLSFPVYYSNTMAYLIETKYQLTDKYAVMGGILRDSSAPRNNTRSISFNSSRFVALFLGANAQVTPEALIQGVVGYGSYRNTPIINPFGYPTNGHFNIDAWMLDLRLVYNLA